MNYSRILVTATALIALAACQPKTATTAAADTSPAIATVNGSPITRDFYEFYIKGITGKTSADLTAQQRTAALDNLIRGKLTGEQAIGRSGQERRYRLSAEPDAPERARAGRIGQVLKDRQPTEQELHAEYETDQRHAQDRIPRAQHRGLH
jgi:hypothetical protein